MSSIEGGDFLATNSPCANSRDALPSPATLYVGENQLPGKKREDVVDSKRERVVEGEVAAGDAKTSVTASSSKGTSRTLMGVGLSGSPRLGNTLLDVATSSTPSTGTEGVFSRGTSTVVSWRALVANNR